MASWTIEYYSSGWVEKTDAALSEIVEELSGHEEATLFRATIQFYRQNQSEARELQLQKRSLVVAVRSKKS